VKYENLKMQNHASFKIRDPVLNFHSPTCLYFHIMFILYMYIIYISVYIPLYYYYFTTIHEKCDNHAATNNQSTSMC